MGKLEGKTAVITGGNDGIGRATAQLFTEEGANVVIFGRRQNKIDEVVAQLGENALGVQGDVRNLADLENLFLKASERFGKIDIVIPNAGVVDLVPIEETTEEIFDRSLNVNLKGAFFTVQKSLPYLNDTASIVFISSIARFLGMPTHTTYTTAKAGVRAMTATLGSELIPRGIRVNCVTPGVTDTKMLWTMGGFPKEAVNNMIEQAVPMKRVGNTRELANTILFLVSDDASFICGEEIIVDGGQVNCMTV